MREFAVQASDVYALAVSLNEAATGTVPFSDCSKDNPACHTVLDAGYGHQELMAAVVAEQLRPCLPAACPLAWARLMAACWHERPDARPSCAQLLEGLAELHAEESLAALEGPLPIAQLLHTPQAAASYAAAAASAPEADGEPAEDMPPAARAPAQRPDWQARVEAARGYRPHVAAGAYADSGLRGTDKMEDRHIVACPLAGTHGANLLAVCDGHRGARAAEFVAAQLPQLLRRCWSQCLHADGAQDGVVAPEGDSLQHSEQHAAPEAERVLAAALTCCEARFAEREESAWAARVQRMGTAAAGARTWPGSAVAAAVQLGGVLAWAHVGDCRAVLCHAGRALQLTCDHVLSNAKERDAIESRGGVVQEAYDGSLRVGAAQLAVSRSIGDLDAKVCGAAGGMSAVAESGSHVLTSQDEFVLVASDGLWDVVSNEDAVALVHDTVKNPSMAAKRLVVEALARGSGDNVTAVVCFLQASEVLESVYKGGVQKYAPADTHHGSRAAVLARLASQRADDELTERL